MNYYKPRQRQDGRWDFTVRNDDDIWPVGYCHEYRPVSKDGMAFFGWPDEYVAELNDQEKPFLDKYHADGHASPEEASECYRRYVLDHELRLNLKHEDEQRKCEVCGEWTQLYVNVGLGKEYILCSRHNTREHVEGLYRSSSEIWSS